MAENEQGAHYKTRPGEQHHERAIRLNLNWYAGNITKYAERAPHKGQMVEDLIKIIDYASMWLAPYKLTQQQRDALGNSYGRLVPSHDGSEPGPGYTNQK